MQPPAWESRWSGEEKPPFNCALMNKLFVLPCPLTNGCFPSKADVCLSLHPAYALLGRTVFLLQINKHENEFISQKHVLFQVWHKPALSPNKSLGKCELLSKPSPLHQMGTFCKLPSPHSSGKLPLTPGIQRQRFNCNSQLNLRALYHEKETFPNQKASKSFSQLVADSFLTLKLWG